MAPAQVPMIGISLFIMKSQRLALTSNLRNVVDSPPGIIKPSMPLMSSVFLTSLLLIFRESKAAQCSETAP